MRAPVLVLFLVLSIALGVLVEILAQLSQRQGGLGLAPSPDQASFAVMLSQYVPTAIAVLYSLFWTWIDLDIRRIQPWLELSRAGGATAESSLLLDYPFEFLAFVPLKAWKKRYSPLHLVGGGYC